MKKVDWKELLRRHSLFSNLESDERKKLLNWFLGEKVSKERHFPAGSIILNEGEFGESVFLIGSGSARAVIMGKHGEVSTELSIMKTGDFFGEIGILQEEARSATVLANQDCTVLEVKGDEFLDLLQEHPDIEIKVLFKLCERLRHTHDQFLTTKLKSLDENLYLFKAKLDAELRVFDAELKACQTVFDQTKLRTDEVINSAERSRTRITVTASVIGTFVTIMIALFGFLGVKQLMNIENLLTDVQKHKEEVEDHKDDIEDYSDDLKDYRAAIEKDRIAIKESKDNVKALSEELHENTGLLYDGIKKAKDYILESALLPGLRDALKTKDLKKAIALYENVKSLRPEDFPYVEGVRIFIVIEITSQEADDPGDYTELLEMIRKDTSTPKQIFLCYYVLLANAILVDKHKFEENFQKFEKIARDYQGEEISEEEYELSELAEFFDNQNQDKQNMFKQINSLIPAG